MFLTITGKLGSGKSTICKILAKSMGLKYTRLVKFKERLH